MKKIDIIVVGAGSRGSAYATYSVAQPDKMRVVGVAEPRKFWRDRMAGLYKIPNENVASDWRDLTAKPKFADAVMITTQDALHAEPTLAFAELGYHILLEKPMAPNPEDCHRIVNAVNKAGILFGICHMLRYTPYTQKLKKMLDAGVIGEVVNIQSLEPVGYWHQAHSFVRGNWRNENLASPMLLSKCCHDLDWIRYLMGEECLAIQSFGHLNHFRPEKKPVNAASRCPDCDYEPDCPYSAKKLYLSLLAEGDTGWPLDILTSEVNEENILEALHTGPYGRCVYECDNNVVDNQVVNMSFKGGKTASLTMMAFTEARFRNTRIFGTRGELDCDGHTIRHFDFMTDKWQKIELEKREYPILDGHGGGDFHLIQTFIDALQHAAPNRILSGANESLETHMMVFAGEASRRENRVVSLSEFL